MNKKKKIIGFLAVIVIAAMAAVSLNVNSSSQTVNLSDISLANVEALAYEAPKADDGTVSLPCCSANSTCSYKVVGKDGSTGTGKCKNAKNC